MDRRYSIQPIIRKDNKEEEEKKTPTYEPTRRGSVVPNFGKTRTWVKRTNLAPEHARPFPETRSSWDESMRRRDSDTGLRGIVLRKGFSDDSNSRNYSLFHAEARRASRGDTSLFSSGKRLCKWETVNLLGIKEQEAEISARVSKKRGQKEVQLLCRIPSREDSGIEITSASTATPGSSALSSKFSHSYLDNVSESEERHDTSTGFDADSEGLGDQASGGVDLDDQRSSAFRASTAGASADKKLPAEGGSGQDPRSRASNKRDTNTAADGQVIDKPPIKRDEERRPSIIPTLNITKEQSNFEKFLNIIGSHKEEPEILELGENPISRTKSCETIRKNDDDDMSIWERRTRTARDFSPGTRPIVLNIEAIDDSVFWSKSGSSTLVASSGRSETYICKDDLHLGSRKSTVSITSGLTVGFGSDGRGGGGAEGGGRSGSKLRKPTNLWGVTRRISVKRKKVTREEKKEEPQEHAEEPR